MSIENNLKRIADALEALVEGRAAATPPPPAASMTPEQLNAALVEQFKRLGSREPIDAVLRDHGVQSITDLDPTQYQSVIDAVKAV